MKINGEKAVKAVKAAAGILLISLTAALLALVVYIMVCNMRGKVANVFSTSVMKVLTGSMEPSIHEGDYIIIRRTDPSALKEGDIICFYSSDREIYGLPNTHRITKVLDDGSFVTKGDANQTEDKVTVSPENVIGKYTGKVRLLRWINSLASLKKFLLLAVIIMTAVMAFYELKSVARINAETKAEKDALIAEEKERLFREAVEKEKKRLYEQGLENPDENDEE